jgi:hypothetical protein
MAHEDSEDGLTVEIGKALIDAVAKYPTLETVCGSQGKSVQTVLNWIRRGQQAGAPTLHARFATAFIKADAEFAGWCHRQFMDLVADRFGSRSAKILLEMMDRRWKLGEGSDVMAVLKQGAKRTDDLEALLMNPSPRIRGLLAKTGWSRPEGWDAPTPVRQLPAASEE